jgi:hypothetical protein
MFDAEIHFTPNYRVHSFAGYADIYDKYNDIHLKAIKYIQIFTNNNILLWVGCNEYVFIGHEIYYFTSLSPIVNFYSTLDTAKSYSIDMNDNYYLFNINVCFRCVYRLKNPYHHYNRLCLLTEDVNTYPRVQPMFKIPIIKEFYIGDTLQTLKYERGDFRIIYRRLCLSNNNDPEQLYVISENGNKTLITEDKYVNLMEFFENTHGFKAIVGPHAGPHPR